MGGTGFLRGFYLQLRVRLYFCFTFLSSQSLFFFYFFCLLCHANVFFVPARRPQVDKAGKAFLKHFSFRWLPSSFFVPSSSSSPPPSGNSQFTYLKSFFSVMNSV
jgi:hypothetical protein